MDKNQYISVLSNSKFFAPVLVFVLVLAFLVHSQSKAQTYSGKSNSLEVQILNEEVTNKNAKPLISWIYPAENVESVGKDEINLKLGITSQTPVVKVTLMVNNQVVKIFDNFSQADPGYLFDAWLENQVQLQPGNNDILLIVQNEQGALKHQRKIEVTTSPSLRKDHALIVAIDEYDTWEDLVGPVRDAEQIARVLEEKGFNIEIVRNVTTFDLLTKLEEYVVKEFQPHDQLFIYFAGHGSYDETTGEGFFVCKNSVNLANAKSTYIAYSAIKSIVNNIPAQHIFLLMDAVRGNGELLTSVFESLELKSPDSGAVVLPDNRTRIGILSGTTKYRQGPAYNAGSYLSKAFITYLRKSEQSEQPTWGDLLGEFKDIEPTPYYTEFGDHSPGNGFIFKQADAEN